MSAAAAGVAPRGRTGRPASEPVGRRAERGFASEGECREPSEDRQPRRMAGGAGDLLRKEKDLTRRRDALEHRAAQPADGRDRQGLHVRRPERRGAPDRPVRGSPAADHLPLHVRSRVGRGLPELHRRHRRDLGRLPRTPAHPRHELRAGLPRAAGEARALEGASRAGTSPGTRRATPTSTTTSVSRSTSRSAPTSTTSAR